MKSVSMPLIYPGQVCYSRAGTQVPVSLSILRYDNTIIKICEMIGISYAKYKVSVQVGVTVLLLQLTFQQNTRSNH